MSFFFATWTFWFSSITLKGRRVNPDFELERMKYNRRRCIFHNLRLLLTTLNLNHWTWISWILLFFSWMDKFIWSTWCLSITWQVRCSIRHCSIAVTGHHVDIWSIDVQQWNACIPVSIRHIQLSTGSYTWCTMLKLLPLTFRNVKTLYLPFFYPSVPVGKVSALLFHRCILKLIFCCQKRRTWFSSIVRWTGRSWNIPDDIEMSRSVVCRSDITT